MKAFRTLLKIAERDLETLRRALAQAMQRVGLIEERIRGHEQTLRAEQQAALKDYESSRAFAGFAVLAAQQRRGLESERELVEQEVERLRALIADAHVEVRKFERLIELEEKRQRSAAEKRENDELDEQATLRHARRE